MADHGAKDKPVFVDVYGTSARLGMHSPSGRAPGGHSFEGPHPDGPYWMRALKGLLPLWMVFWGGFVFGHGIILAFSVAVAIVGFVVTMIVDPGHGQLSDTAVWGVGIVIAFVFAVFAVWAVISVWRCAPNTTVSKWRHGARAAVVGYVIVWATVIYSYAA